MLTRLLFTLFIGGTIFVAFWWLNHQQHKRTAVAVQSSTVLGQARLLYFYGRSCAACNTQAHILGQLDDNAQKLIERIDVVAAADTAKQYNILTLPTTVLIDGKGDVQQINYGLVNLGQLQQQLQVLV